MARFSKAHVSGSICPRACAARRGELARLLFPGAERPNCWQHSRCGREQRRACLLGACRTGSGATNGDCEINERRCRFRVRDTRKRSRSSPMVSLPASTCAVKSRRPAICACRASARSLPTVPPATRSANHSVYARVRRCLPGDCNLDASIDADDSICVRSCVVGAPDDGAECGCSADCNCLAGTEAGDVACAILRQARVFGPRSVPESRRDW